MHKNNIKLNHINIIKMLVSNFSMITYYYEGWTFIRSGNKLCISTQSLIIKSLSYIKICKYVHGNPNNNYILVGWN